MATIKKTIKTITVNADKCNGCRTCEVVCSAFHASPAYSSNSPSSSRVQVVSHRLKDIWLPIFAGEYTAAECAGREKYRIGGKEYDECSLCRAPCPSRDIFKDPDTDLPLRCDMCEGEEKPLCVEWCLNDVLVYEEREEEVEEQPMPDEIQIGLSALIDKHGIDRVRTLVTRTLARQGDGSERAAP